MPNWNAVLNEIQRNGQALDNVRVKYLKKLHRLTKRNVIAYYSGWLQKPGKHGVDITDVDKNGFMNAIHKMDRDLGLDLILHTPGGDVAAAESLVDYLRSMFGKNIRAIIPQIAMSAGTIVACSCKSIVMGKESNVGPIDPHFNGIPAAGVVEEFSKAIAQIKEDPGSLPIWQAIIGKYHPTFIGQCEKAVKWAREIAISGLRDVMFEGMPDAEERATRIADALIVKGHNYNHSVHISMAQCQELGLNIERLEDNNELQDTVLTIHHSFMHAFSNAPCIKIVENHSGNRIVNFIKE